MGSVAPRAPEMGLGNHDLLAKIDKLRELNIGAVVPLPQLVAVGDQSSGKSSVLESLTGFSFPSATRLCTRYATQITCRREAQSSISISIIPRRDADRATEERLRAFRRSTETLDEEVFRMIFHEAGTAMGIRPLEPTSDELDDLGLTTFSQDILRIEISGPTQNPLTVIDVPGIFRTATPGLTTDHDIAMVEGMVKGYMNDPRTIILAVIPCNVDIATQGILKLAQDADPDGIRTMGVLTKPDLVTEQATRANVVDLVLGNRNDLKLGYCVVKNRGADDTHSTIADRNQNERNFFAAEPWHSLATATGRVGTESLNTLLRELLTEVTRREFPNVKADCQKKSNECQKKLGSMGDSRGDERSQRTYINRLAARFEKTVSHALNACYTEDPLFDEFPHMKLITRIIELNDLFAEVFRTHGHTRRFDYTRLAVTDREEEDKADEGDASDSYPGPQAIGSRIPTDDFPEIGDLVPDEDYRCEPPSPESIMDHIKGVFKSSRGPELGTFSGALLGTTFKEQSRKWVPIVLAHVRSAIAVVHSFIWDLLLHVVLDKRVLDELWNNILLEKLLASYKQALDHAKFLLVIEREGKPTTYNHYFNANLQKKRTRRLQDALSELKVDADDEYGGHGPSWAALENFTINKSNDDQVCEDLHDILQSYYKVSMKRFVDVICQQVIDHFLLNGPGSPLNIFNQSLVIELTSGQLEDIAGEDTATKLERERLQREIKNLEAAMEVIRS